MDYFRLAFFDLGVADLYLAGSFQAFVLAVLLWFTYRFKMANRFLSIYLVILGSKLIIEWAQFSQYIEFVPNLLWVDTALGFLVGPLGYLYVRNLLKPAKLKVKDTFIFAGALAGLLLHIPNFQLPEMDKLNFIASGLDENIYQLPVSTEVIRWALILFTMPFFVRIVQIVHYDKLNPDGNSCVVRVNWLSHTLKLQGLALVIYAFSILVTPELQMKLEFVVHAILALSIYLIGYFSLMQDQLFGRYRDEDLDEFDEFNLKP